MERWSGAAVLGKSDMRPLAQWPVRAVVLVCFTWIVLCLLVPLIWVAIKLRSEMVTSSGSGGVGGVSVGVSTLVVILPPMLFCLAWLIARRRNRAAARTM
jgi:hypothetical protein